MEDGIQIALICSRGIGGCYGCLNGEGSERRHWRKGLYIQCGLERFQTILGNIGWVQCGLVGIVNVHGTPCHVTVEGIWVVGIHHVGMRREGSGGFAILGGRQVSSRVGILQETGRILDALSIEVVQCIGQSDLPPSDQEDLVFVVAFLLESLSNQVKHFMFFLLLVESPAVKSAFVHTFPNGLVSETIGRRRVDLRRGKVKLPLQILCDLLQSPTLFEIKLSDEWTMPPPFLAGVRVGGTFGRLPLPIDWRSIG